MWFFICFFLEQKIKKEKKMNGEGKVGFFKKVANYFQFEERKTNYRKEIIGGIVTFLAMSYILAVNPNMVSGRDAGVEFLGIPYGGVFLATAIGGAIATLLMGLVAKLPIALAPGMGVNAFFMYVIVLTLGYTWQEALAVSLIGGVIFFLISFTKFRQTLIRAIPTDLRYAIGAGIGLFIAFVGLKGAGIIAPDGATLVTLGDLTNPSVLLAILGIVIIVVIHVSKSKLSKFSFIIAIVTTAAIGLIVGGIAGAAGDDTVKNLMPQFGAFDYSELGQIKDVAFVGVFEGFKTLFGGHHFAEIGFLVFALLFVDIFDTAGTFVACAGPAGLIDEEGNVTNINKAMICDAAGTLISSALGTPEITSYVESTTGIQSGARTGFSSVVVALLFLVSIVAFPIFAIFNSAVTACALVLVGVLMMEQVKLINWDDKVSAVSCFITIIVMMLSYSIADGIAFGFITYTIGMLASGRWKKVHVLIYILSALFVIYFAVMPLVEAGKL